MTLDKAYDFLEGKKNILIKKLIILTELIEKNITHYEMTDTILKRLKMQIEIDNN